MTYDQIGKLIGTSRQNVYEIYNKALKNLRMIGDPNV
jgi:DNA-directed RNA polymerase sigma subunit (sigma70/sigma32)